MTAVVTPDLKSGHAIEGLEVTISTLTVQTAAGLIDGRSVAANAAAGTLVASTTVGKFRGQLVSEDGDGTFTVTLGTDDLASAALAAADAQLIDVPSGGIAISTHVVKQDGTVSDPDISVRGKVAKITLDATTSL